jgi:tetratricopeptide (TPR) repeat protein
LSAAAQSPDSPAAIEPPKETPQLIARAATAAVQNKDYDQAQELFLKAISLDKDDAGADYDPWKFPELDEQAKSHGEMQLLKMFIDRRSMGKFIDDSDDLYQWTKNKYATKILGREIDWDKRPPSGNWDAEHSPPTAVSNGMIRVRNAPLKASVAEAFEELWYRTVFELHNIENA